MTDINLLAPSLFTERQLQPPTAPLVPVTVSIVEQVAQGNQRGVDASIASILHPIIQ